MSARKNANQSSPYWLRREGDGFCSTEANGVIAFDYSAGQYGSLGSQRLLKRSWANGRGARVADEALTRCDCYLCCHLHCATLANRGCHCRPCIRPRCRIDCDNRSAQRIDGEGNCYLSKYCSFKRIETEFRDSRCCYRGHYPDCDRIRSVWRNALLRRRNPVSRRAAA